ncbi:GIY-YIG nuclease family protein (plasmid) [Pontibacillus sp. ALD_SL1]|uniref:GIY-YIG nuclease family protein n=1 Tax=Pontibacillus sp. ALD_SL1 TaxID=2777185 RepID=UPI001A96AF7E|nr:GIY-YIG nuclease family protein [Pontibacillus sp. ALD_SL1]QST02271.1 GIY-YIG nuclease family protein [Pontibacillus sp. ALD_SL1]
MEELRGWMKIMMSGEKIPLQSITAQRVRGVLQDRGIVGGVYVFVNGEDQVIYVGRSKHLAQRLVDHKNKDTNVTKRIAKLSTVDLDEASQYLTDDVSVQFLRVNDPYDRAMLEAYVAKVHGTPLNVF